MVKCMNYKCTLWGDLTNAYTCENQITKDTERFYHPGRLFMPPFWSIASLILQMQSVFIKKKKNPSRISHKWNQIVRTHHVFEIHLFCRICHYFFFVPSSSGYNFFYPFSCWFGVVSSQGLPWIKVLWIFFYKSFCRHMFFFLWVDT